MASSFQTANERASPRNSPHSPGRRSGDFGARGRLSTKSQGSQGLEDAGAFGWWGPLDGPRPSQELAPEAVSTPQVSCAASHKEQAQGLLARRPSLRDALEDTKKTPELSNDVEAAEDSAATPAEVFQLRLKLAAVREEIKKCDASLQLLPGSTQLGAEHTTKVNAILQHVCAKAPPARRRTSNVGSLAGEPVLKDDGFVAVPGHNTLPGQNAYKMVAIDLDECKKMCRVGIPGKGVCGAFVVSQGRASFRTQSVSECRANLVPDSTCTTYLNSTPEAAAGCTDLRRAALRRYELRRELQLQGVGSAETVVAEGVGSAETVVAEGSTPNSAASNPPAESSIWKESIAALEGELKRKSAHGLELHRRVHELEQDLQLQLKFNDQRVDDVKKALENTLSRSKAGRVPR